MVLVHPDLAGLQVLLELLDIDFLRAAVGPTNENGSGGEKNGQRQKDDAAPVEGIGISPGVVPRARILRRPRIELWHNVMSSRTDAPRLAFPSQG